jgi:hypothetical protein
VHLPDVTKPTWEAVLAVNRLASRQGTTDDMLMRGGDVSAGLVVGTLLALLLAPKAGRGLWEDMGAGLRRAAECEEIRKALRPAEGPRSEARS